MNIIKGTDAITVTHPVFLIFGQPGIGKSSLGYSTKDGLTLDFDKGAHRAANRKDTLVIDTWADVVELMASKDALVPYASLTVDTVGRCLDMMTAHIAETEPKKAPGGNLSLQGWGTLKTNFRMWMAQLRAKGKDVLLVAHDKEEKDGDLRVVRPEIVGASYGEVMKVSDFVGYLYMSGKDRVIDFNPTDRWVGKNPAQWAPFKVPPVAKAGSFMADLFDRGREALGKISEESAAVATIVETWMGTLASFTEPEECTDAIPLIKTLPTAIAPQIKKLLLDRATALGFVYDVKAKKFVPKELLESASVAS